MEILSSVYHQSILVVFAILVSQHKGMLYPPLLWSSFKFFKMTMNLPSFLQILGPSFVVQGEAYFRNSLFDLMLCSLVGRNRKRQDIRGLRIPYPSFSRH